MSTYQRARGGAGYRRASHWASDTGPHRYAHSHQPGNSRPQHPYRSRGEVVVADVLHRGGVPFQYEHPTPIYDRGIRRIWHPDFTLPDRANLIVEYAGMPDRHDYRVGMDYKQMIYGANGRRAMFVWPDDLKGYAWPQRLLDRINRAAQVDLTGDAGRLARD